MIRKTIAILTVLALIWSSAALGADIIYEKDVTERVASGILYTQKTRLQDNGIEKIHIIEADLNNETVSVRPMAAKDGMSYLSNVLNMAKTYGAVAAVNTDFFSWNNNETGRAHAMNLQVTDGQVRSSSGIDGGYASLAFTEDGQMLMDYFKTDITVTAKNGESHSVYLINQYNDYTKLLMYTPAWGRYSRGSKNNCVEMLVVDGVVDSFYMNQDPIEIPANGYILTTSMEWNYFLNGNFQVGDEVVLDIQFSPDTDKIKHAVSGGSMLVAEGERAEFTHNITGRHPRTAIGFTEDGTLLLVAVDGRQNNALGMSQEELSDLMIELGAVYAMNCDGGGSTTLVARPEGQFDLAVKNSPSGGSMRAVSAALGVFSNAKIGKLAKINSVFSADRICLGDSVSVYSNGVDEYENPCDLSDKAITYESDNGSFKNNVLTPDEVGIANVTVSSGKIRTELALQVLDPVGMTAYPAGATLQVGKSQKFAFIGYDEKGVHADISPGLITLKTDDADLSVSGSTVTLKGKKGGIVTAVFGDCEVQIPITAKGEAAAFTMDLVTPDDALYQTSAKGTQFAVLPAKKETARLVDGLVNKILTRKTDESDYEEILTPSKKYGATEKDGILTVTADFSSRSLLSQWKTLFGDLKETDAEHILLVLNAPLEFKLSEEEALFRSELEALAEDKTVFVITPDRETACRLDCGVRYMTVSEFADLTLKDFAVDKERFCYPEFSLHNGKLTYRFVSVV